MRLLSGILEFLFPSRDTERLVREAAIESVGMHVRPVLHEDGTVTLLPYRTPLVRALIVEAKFRGNEKAQALLGTVLADYLQEAHGDSEIVIVPVPLSAEREKERGYNQCERIARQAPSMRIDSRALMRVRDTAPQTSLDGHARRQNLVGAFSAQELDPAYLYIVLDDVMTTGATLSSAIEALKDAGAERILGLSLAH